MQRQTLSFYVAAILSTTLVACGGGGDSSTPPPTPPPPPPPPAPDVEFPVQSAAPQLADLSENGVIFTSESGLSLYLFDNDSAGASSCNAEAGAPAGGSNDTSSCAAIWPPLLAASDATASGSFTLVSRDDGTNQWAWNDFPLYQFMNDSAQGEINGDGVNGIWHLARPAPLKSVTVSGQQRWQGNQTILSATSTADVLELFRADKDGFSLYIFDNDSIDTVNCISDACTTNWPPLMADGGAKPNGMLTLVERGEEQQWAYNGKPLYFFTNDTAAGDSNGDGIGNVWHLATQDPAQIRTNAAGTLLTATGKTSALVEDSNNAGSFIVEVKAWDQFTLYTFANDGDEQSNCVDTCAQNWPAFIAPEGATASGDFSIFTRGDGNAQWAYKQQPLYFFVNDTEKAQANGDGAAGGLFNIIEPTPDTTTTTLMAERNLLGSVVTVDGEVQVLVSDGNGGSEVQLQDKSGFALYTFNNDAVNTSNCTSASCMANWPALLATDSDTATAPFEIFERSDGHRQWSINGKPLYFFAADNSASDTSGDAVGSVWYIARPAPVRVFTHETKGTFLVANMPSEASIGKSTAQLHELTLYTFNDDTANSGQSTCFGGCASTWPPLYASATDQAIGDFTIINRTENDSSTTRQWAYKGLPLYFFQADVNLGDTFGDYPGWPLARP